MTKEEQNNRAFAQQKGDNSHLTIQSSSPYLGEGQDSKMGFSVSFVPLLSLWIRKNGLIFIYSSHRFGFCPVLASLGCYT